MNDRQIECFIRLSDNLNFAQTTDEMYLAQSTISREIQNLEDELGFKLFIRTAKSVRLSEDGIKFKNAIKPLLNSLKNSISNIRNEHTIYKTTLKMGFFHIASLKNIPKAIEKFHNKYPYILPEIHQGSLNQLNSLFHSNQLDLMFAVKSIMEPKENDIIKTIYKGKMVATLSTKHPLANEEYLNFNLMNGYDILTLDHSSSSKCFEPFNHEVRLHCPNSNFISCSTTDEQEAYLRSNIGIVISTEYSFAVDGEIKQVPFKEKSLDSLETDYAVMYRKNNNEYLGTFLNYLDDVFR